MYVDQIWTLWLTTKLNSFFQAHTNVIHNEMKNTGISWNDKQVQNFRPVMYQYSYLVYEADDSYHFSTTLVPQIPKCHLPWR